MKLRIMLVGIVFLLAASEPQFVQCKSVTVSQGGGSQTTTTTYKIEAGSIATWDDATRAWERNICATGAKCKIDDHRYVAEETWINRTGKRTLYKLVINRETGKVQETWIVPGASDGMMFNGDCGSSSDPSLRAGSQKF